MAMICQHCGKEFHKGEHLRRHERSHTGHKPFACTHCARSFSRQDSLLRHQKVHRKTNSVPKDHTDISTDVNAFNDGLEILQSRHASIEQRESDNQLHNESQFSDMDLTLIWPDSEDLFQSLFSTDLSTAWQLPPITVPLPSAPFTSNGLVAEPAGNSSAYGDSPSYRASIPAAAGVQVNEGQHRSGDNQIAVLGVSQMISNYSSSLTAAVESKSITSIFLDECLHMFFDRFIPIFPIMHRPTFVYRDCSHSLLLNAIAIGSLYLGPADSVAKGEALWRLAHTAVATSWQSLITHRGPYDACPGVQLVLSSLLSVVYGALSKSTAIRSASQALHASAFFWARQCGIFKCEPYNLSHLSSIFTSESEKIHQWKRWAAHEIQQRALLSHFVLDGLIAHMQGNPTSVRHTSNTLHLPHSERAFQETNVDAWLESMRSVQEDHCSFRDIYKVLFDEPKNLSAVTSTFSNFSLRVLLEALQSVIADSDEYDGAIVHPPDPIALGTALYWAHDRIQNCSEISKIERLEVRLRWHAVCLEAVVKTPQLCNSICKRWHAHQDLWPNNNLRDQDYDLSQLAGSSDGRRALLHAIAIQSIVEELPRGRAHAVHMPSSLFAAATIYGAFSFARHTNVRMPVHIKWNDVVVPVKHTQDKQSDTTTFIRDGHSALTPTSTTPRNVFYELNSVQKLFNGLSTQWGISHDMEKVVSQWIALCHP